MIDLSPKVEPNDTVFLRAQLKQQEDKLVVETAFLINLTKHEPTNTVKVYFYDSDIPYQEVEKGALITKPDNLTKQGFIFEGWFKDSSFKEAFDFNEAVLEDMTLYPLFYVTIKKALEIGQALTHNTLSDNYYIKGTVKSITNSEYGGMTITDGVDELFVYGVWGLNGEKYSELEDRPVINDIVYLYGPIKKYNEAVELNRGNLIKFEKGEIPPFDISDYEALSIKDAYERAVGSKVLVEGIVTFITKQTKFQNNGLYLTDDTGAIYIYDLDIASVVNIGDRIKVAATRNNFILPTEQALAEKLFYQGAIQINEAHLITHEKNNEMPNLDWVEENTIKALLDTNPKEANITGTIFKVNAFINKVIGTGFTNYYFNDLDNKTGSYTYSMNNGNDFTWLDPYDGELRAVYISIINAKSTPSGVVYRFVPIQIGDIATFDVSNAPKYALDLVAMDQFLSTYNHGYSPDKEMITSVDIEHFDITGITLNYESTHPSVASFVDEADKLIFKTNEIGTTTITITATYLTHTLSRDVIIEVVSVEEYELKTIQEVIDTPQGELIHAEGVVGPSLVNKVGFYLVDESGIIAVELPQNELEKVQQGNMIVIKGRRDYAGRVINEATNEITVHGTTAIRDAQVVVNKQGQHNYPTTSFNGGEKTILDLGGFDLKEDHSTTVYKVEATIVYVETTYYKRYQIEDDEGNYYLIYASNASQLTFLDAFRGQKVTMEFSVVNWNGKAWRGSILAVIKEDGKVINNSNFR